MQRVIGIDIGGTAVKYGLLTVRGEILKSGEFSTDGEKGIENLLSNIYDVIDMYMDNNVLGIAVSGTGQINGEIGEVIGGAPIIPGWIGTNLVKILEEKYKIPAVLENDVNCAALGEKWKGAGAGEDDFLCLTIGTGIGGGIILNGNIYRGNSYVAGEFGHILVEKNGIKCSCGKTGCYEKYASTSALVRMVEEKTGKKMNGKEIFELYHQGDNTIKEIINIWIEYLTDGLGVLIYVFNPKLVILGGGVTKQGEYLLQLIKSSLSKKCGENYLKNLVIKFATLENSAGMLGAEYLLLKKIGYF